MKIARSKDEMRSIRRELNGTVAFVPTMGALHRGHLSLIECAKEAADNVVASIFVNPLQFNETSDFDKYPRDTESDLERLKDAGVDITFLPEREDIYRPGSSLTSVSASALKKTLCGKNRPGHFDGVVTVLSISF